ncbi:MAG: hypothetical protein VX619_06090 [bacterium]|nr:hypothetical protein [bacterium]
MKALLNIILVTLFTLTTTYSSSVGSGVGIVRLNLSTAFDAFEQLRTTDSLVYSLDIHRQLYRKSCDEINKSYLEIQASAPTIENFEISHALASKAFLRIRDLKASGLIGYKSSEARIMFTFAIRILRDSVLGLHKLKQQTEQQDLFNSLYSIQD